MAFIGTIIVDPDNLNTGGFTAGTGNLLGHYYTSEIHINCVDKTFHFLGGGNLDTSGDGVTGQALYSYFKDRWQDTSSITKYDFPMLSITNEQFEFIDGWIPDDGATVTYTDLEFNNVDPDTITTAAGDFTKYFKSGDTLDVSGSVSNDGTYTIDTVAALTITLVATDTLVDEGTADVTATLTSNVVTQGAFTTTTSKIIRTAGWAETIGQLVNKRVSGIVSLGTLVDNTDQPYYAQSASTTAGTSNTTYTGPVNEGVRIYSHVQSTTGEIDFVSTNTISSTGPRLDVFQVGDVITVTTTTSNNTDYTVAAIVSPYEITTVEAVVAETPTNADLEVQLNTAFNLFVRERTKIYADSNLADIGVTGTMTYIVYRFPVSNADDLNSTVLDTGIDLAVTEASGADFDFTGATTLASTAADLSVFGAGDLIKIVGSSDNDGFYLVASGTANLLTIDTATAPFDAAPYTGFNTTDDTGLTVTVTEAGVADVSPYDVINVTYLLNPDTGTGDVNITGAWASGFTYSLGDVAFDTGDSKGDGDARWYFLDATTSGGLSAGANMNADSNNTWTLWDKSSGGGERWVKDGFYAYNVIIDANNSVTAGDTKADSPYTDAAGNTKEKVYDWAQWSLRQDTFIDIGASRNGNVADVLANFVGATLSTASGVFIDDLAPVDTNAVALTDYAGISHTYPLVVTVTINFNSNLTGDPDAQFYAYYDDPDGVVNGNEYGTTGALQVVKSPSGNVGADVSPVPNNIQDVFDVAGDSFYRFSYAYDADTTGGRTVSTDTDIVVVAIGLNTGQYVRATGTITDEGATVSLVAPLERNYSNP